MHKSLLTPEVEERTRAMREKMARCARGWTLYRREIGDGDSRALQTMARVWACGLRACDRCAGAAWRRARTRMLGSVIPYAPPAWRTFVTLTFSRERPPMEVWQSIGRWVREWVRQLRELAWRLSPARGPRGGLVRTAPIQYAWVIEPHPFNPSWPHVHLVIDFTVEDKWLRREIRQTMKEEWRRITNRAVQWIVFEDVRCQEEAAHYLTKYLTKSDWDITLLAVMYRRRRFGTSRPSKAEESGGWRKGEDLTWEQARKWREFVQASSRTKVTVDRPGLLIVEHPAEFLFQLLQDHPELPSEPRDPPLPEAPKSGAGPPRSRLRWHFDAVRAASVEAALLARCQAST